jgi:hypothetical protein
MTESMQVTLRSSFTPYVVEKKSYSHQHRKRNGNEEDASEFGHP